MAQPQDPTQPNKPDLRELGVSGTRLYAGLIQEETVPQLQGQNAYKAWQGMRMDATGSALLKAIELPIRSTRWMVNPASDDKKDSDLADLTHDVIWNFGNQSFDDICRLALGSLGFGFALLEILWQYIDDGPWQGKIGWAELAWRSQATKWRWNVEWVGGRRQLVSMTQLAPPYYEQIDIPRDKFLLWVNDLEGQNFDGNSLLRPAWKDYFIRDRLYRIRAIGLERAYMGIPVVNLQAGFSDELAGLARQIVETVRVDEQAGVILPADQMTFEMLFNRLNEHAMDGAILYHNRQMLLAQLAQFLDLGSGQAGAYSLSSDHSELFLNAINAKANYFAEVLNLDPGIPTLIRFNFPNVERARLPKLEHGDIGQTNLGGLGRTLQALGQWGFLTPDDPTEDRLRQMLDLPEREETITDRTLYDLIQEVTPIDPEHGRQHPQALTPVPAQAGVVGGPAVAPEQPPGQAPRAPTRGRTAANTSQAPPATMSEYDPRFAENRARLAEHLVRQRWLRPKGRPTEGVRMAVQATEKFAEALEDHYQTVQYRRTHKPPRPSEVIARNRRPYEVRMAAPLNDQPKRLEPGQPRTQLTRQMALAKRHEKHLADLLRPRP